MARASKTDAPADPNKLVRQGAGTYRSADERFEVREGGTGWFLVDSQQTNEFGQELVQGPFPTLNAVREALPDARRTAIRPVPRPKPSKPKAAPKPKARPKAKPKPPPEHRLGRLLREAARDRFPRVDLDVEIVGSPPGRADAVVAFSGHNVIAAELDADDVRAHLPHGDPGGPMSAPFLTWLGIQLGVAPGMLDVVLVADGTGDAGSLERRGDADEHERVARARQHRSGVEVYSDAERNGLVILGRGLANRLEVSIEVEPKRRGRGIGVRLAKAALGLVPDGEPLFAQVSPGNVASLRAFLRAGYRPICSEVLFLRDAVTSPAR